jgi:flap endonuclease-1
MGVKNLNSLIEKYSPNGKSRQHLSYFNGSTFAVDTNVYLYKYLYGKSNHIDGMFFMVNKFKKFGITPIFIFDGKPPTEKMNTIIQRKEAKQKLHERILDLKAQINIDDFTNNNIETQIENIEKRIVFVNVDIIQSTKELLDLMGVSYIDATAEAEHYCAKLNQLGLVSGVVSEDMDTIACGTKMVIRNFSNRDDMVDVYYLDNILSEMNLSYDSFIDMCILLGNDYIQRPRGYTPCEIYTDIMNYGTIDVVMNNRDIKMTTNITRLRDLFYIKDIDINISNIHEQMDKKWDIEKLIEYMNENSNIDEPTIKHRINKMFNKTNLYNMNSPTNKTFDCWR